MQDRYKNLIKLFFILYVFKLKINLLFKRKIYIKNLQESFNNKDLYMHDKREK